MSRKTNAADSGSEPAKTTKFTYGELLRKALEWAINDRMFADIHLHGNIKWSPRQLVILAAAAGDSETAADLDGKGR